MEPFDAPEVVLGATTFHIGVLLPMEAYRVFEAARPALGPVLETSLSTGSLADIVSSVISALPPATVEQVRVALFRQVTYRSDLVPTPQTLAGNEDSAFAALTPYHVWEIMARAAYRNFSASFSAAQSRLAELIEAAAPPPGTSPSSSPASSTPDSAPTAS